MANNSTLLVPQAKAAINQLKYEVAQELGSQMATMEISLQGMQALS